jgi:hypothetical protein
MRIEKLKYFNNYQTVASLMIDDLVPTAITYDGILKSWNDWGYGRQQKDGIFHYFKRNFLDLYPEVRGTIFIPLESQHYLPKDSGMKILKNDFSEHDTKFFNELKENFDFGFHGIRHTYSNDDSFFEPNTFEFSVLNMNDIPYLKEKILGFIQLFEFEFLGGKFPGYHRKNIDSFRILKELGFKWWAYSLSDNKISNHNDIKILQEFDVDIIDIPSNVNGNLFNQKLSLKPNPFYKKYYYSLKQKQKENIIEYLYQNRLPITIQEHFQNQSFNGKRQKPNVFDDIFSLQKIYSLLRGADIWHATCDELAHYFDSFQNTQIIMDNKTPNQFEIKYEGLWDEPFLSIAIDAKIINRITDNSDFAGIYKGGKFIFNIRESGLYKILC